LAEFSFVDNVEQIGYSIEPEYIDLDIYRLVCCFGGSRVLRDFAKGKGKAEKEYFFHSRFAHETTEISRLLVSIAATVRNNMDNLPSVYSSQPPKGFNGSVGVLYNDVTRRKRGKELLFRDACNKIIHASKMNFDVSNTKDYESSYLKPRVYLYGEFKGGQWRAVLDIDRFAYSASCYT
jgi:hypothetical protein